jgi:S-sulfo-L-cysteine synthase (O-acetyl-L-serine-dependent)
VGTGGSLTGIGRRLRSARPDVWIAALAPDDFPGIEGLKPLGSPGDFVPPILDTGLIDERIPVRQEEAVPTCQALARAGFFVGPSSGANVWAAVQLARTGRFQSVATLLCDTGERYGSTGLWAHE